MRDLRHIGAFPALADFDRGETRARHRDEAKNERISAARRERWLRANRDARSAVSADLAPYLFGRQHDAFVVGAEREGERFTLTALDEDLSMIVEWKYDRDRRTDGIPFALVFEGVEYVGWREELGDGRLRSVAAPREFPSTEWGNDTLVDPESPGVRWAMRMHHQRYERGHYKGDATLLLLVEAERMRVVEPDRATWGDRFGPGELELFDRYRAARAHVSLGHHPERWAEFGIDRSVDAR